MCKMASIPVVDISYLVSHYHGKKIDPAQFSADRDIQNLSTQLFHVLGAWGFVYLRGHMIDELLIQRAFEEGKKFFKLNDLTKQKVARPEKYDDCGYLSVNMEVLSPDRPCDYKECFTMAPGCQVEAEAEATHPTLWNAEKQLYGECQKLAFLLCHLFDVCLGIGERSFLAGQHENIGNYQMNSSTMRVNYYPPVRNANLADLQLSCSEHSDFGSFTLLFQDDKGGLQVGARLCHCCNYKIL